MEILNKNLLADYVNHSGGALGSDSYWDLIGNHYGMVTNKHYYHEHKTSRGNTQITDQDYLEGKKESAKAARRNWGISLS